jgi:hypothetical protein
MKELTSECAIELHDSGIWRTWSHRQIAEFQMSQQYLCVPFSVFHEAVEKTLGRPVWTHEFGVNYAGLKAELFDGADPPTMQEIMEQIPEEKRIVVCVTSDKQSTTTELTNAQEDAIDV